MTNTSIIEATKTSLNQEAQDILNVLQATMREYKEMLSALEKENQEYARFQDELKRIATARGIPAEQWESGITVKERWEVEERLFGKTKAPTPTDEKVIGYCYNSLNVLDSYAKIFKALVQDNALSSRAAAFLKERKAVSQQLDTSLPITQKPLSIVGGNTIAQKIDNFARAHLKAIAVKEEA